MTEYTTISATGRTRSAVDHLGRDVIVAPATLLVPGVLPGSNGPLMYPADEVGRHPDGWNGMPITINHPSTGGTARHPEVLSRQGVGHVYNAAIRDGKLVGELWLDVERLGRVEPRVLEALRRNEPVELSTGLFTRNDPASPGATHNGRGYTHVARNLRPDHLAILPDTTGACSLRDGCGVLVNKKAPPPVSWSEAKALFPRSYPVNPFEHLIANCGCDLDPVENLLVPGSGSVGLFGPPPAVDPAAELTVNVAEDGGLIPIPATMVW